VAGAPIDDVAKVDQGAAFVFVPCPTITVNPATLPAGTVGAAFSQTLTATGGTAPFTFSFSSGALPPGLTLSQAGVISGTPTAAGAFTFTVQALNSTGCTGTRAFTLFIATPPAVVTVEDDDNNARNAALAGVAAGAAGFFAGRALAPGGPRCGRFTVVPVTPALPACVIGQPYSLRFSTSDGTSPHNFIVKGAPPPGLTLDPNGNLSGTPTATGAYNFSVAVTDARNCSSERPYTLVVNQSSTSATGNPGALPAGSALAGAPDGLSAGSALAINPDTLPTGTAGLAYKQTLVASGVAMPFRFSVAGGSLPAGLTLAPSGSISGTPTAAGTSNFTALVTDRYGNTAMRDYTITVNPPCSKLSLSPAKLQEGEIGEAYSHRLKADGGTGPFIFALVDGALPAGLMLDPATGSIRGKPQQAATSKFKVRVTDSGGCMGEIAYNLKVATRKSKSVSSAGFKPQAATNSAPMAKASAGRNWRETERKRSKR
jgi:large repetitive protein